MKHFRDTYQIPFPLFPDGDLAIHTALGGEIRTPYFIVVKIMDEGTHEIFYTQLGGFKKADEFLQLIVKKSGLKQEVSCEKQE